MNRGQLASIRGSCARSSSGRSASVTSRSRIRIRGRWLIDFASCNYLGLDLDREVIEGIPAHLDRWGTHPGWSRMQGSPVLYEQIEA